MENPGKKALGTKKKKPLPKNWKGQKKKKKEYENRISLSNQQIKRIGVWSLDFFNLRVFIKD